MDAVIQQHEIFGMILLDWDQKEIVIIRIQNGKPKDNNNANSDDKVKNIVTIESFKNKSDEENDKVEIHIVCCTIM